MKLSKKDVKTQEIVNIGWETLLDRYQKYAEKRMGSLPPGANLAQINFLKEECQRLNLIVDDTFIAFLNITNGTGYDGLTFCGIDIPKNDKYGRLDLLEGNCIIEERGLDTIYGQWQDELFVRVAGSGCYERRSIFTGNARETFDTCEALLVSVLDEEVNYLDYRSGINLIADIPGRRS